MFHDQAMAEQWIIQVQGKEYGPADLDTLREWKADGRILPANPARMVDVDSAVVAGFAEEALWKTAADIPGLFQVEPPPVQVEAGSQPSAAYAQDSGEPEEVRDQKPPTKPPSRNILVETFRIYFRGFLPVLLPFIAKHPPDSLRRVHQSLHRHPRPG